MSIKQYPGGIVTKNPTAPTTAAAKGIWTLDQVSNYVKQGIWPRSPGAPTIGTATIASSTSATVTYTAPTDLGTGSITYTATSSPGGLTGTGASPITVTGLTTGTSYTFTVRAATPGGTGPASAASNSIVPAIQPGDAYEGGYFAGQISTAGNGIADFNLVVGPASSSQTAGKQWKTSNTSTAGTTSVIDGPTNSANMNNASHPAAEFCEAVTAGGYTDWYMPAKNELDVCYFNLKPTALPNVTYGTSGVNANAVPPRATGYTPSSPPTQTSATIFQSPSGAETFGEQYFWSSTQLSAPYAWSQVFTDGANDGATKNYTSRRVRAIRRVAV